MKRLLLALLLALAPLTLHAQTDGYWTCPMHPHIVEAQKEACPICGMDLVPAQSAKSAWSQHDKPMHDKATGPAVTIDPVVVQNMGVRIAHVTRSDVLRRIRTIGEVEVAEDEVSVINLRFSGWIEKIWADETGQRLEKGQWLFSIYSPEVIAAQEELILAVNTRGRDSRLARAAEQRLRRWEVPSAHIDKVLKEGNGQVTLVVRAPRAGFVLQKSVVQGARVIAGRDLYRIGDLRSIWVNADIYDFDAPWIAEGQPATMELSFHAGRRWQGSVDYIHPTLSERTRTLRVRLKFENPGLNLRPGMFATVRIEAQHRKGALVVPTESILYSGERRIVFVSPKLGHYEPREVVTGLSGDNRVTEVLEGLDEGEAVVTSGQFLLDSESQLQEAVQKLLAARLQHRNGDAPKTPAPHFTCPMHPQIVEDAAGICPICGMDLVEQK